MAEQMRQVRTPWFPRYSRVRQLLRILDGVPQATVIAMIDAILAQTGTVHQPVDWSEPDTWIAERLTGANADLARGIWVESDRTVNPRHIRGSYLFINTYGLLVPDAQGIYRLSERGHAFLKEEPNIVRELDVAEGLVQLLTILATKTRAKRADLLPEWTEYLREHSTFGSASTITDTLYRRLVNLVERGYIKRQGQVLYEITPAGIEYAAADVQDKPVRDVFRAITAFNDQQKQMLRERLAQIDPYRFEHLVRELLQAMGYEDVQVTKASGDRGVDVIATVQFGITTITEVVQVKRHQGSINRQVLDQLRGALPYHKAIRGTIITLGKFTQGCKDAALFPGAVPIGLIDGDRLLELLFEHTIGVKRRAATQYELNEDFFAEPIEEGPQGREEREDV